MIAMEAPKAAAEDMPTVKGLTKGFLVTPCIAAPANASPAPDAIPMKTRGSRRCQTMPSTKGSLGTKEKNLDAMELKTSKIPFVVPPIEAETRTKRNKIARLPAKKSILRATNFR